MATTKEQDAAAAMIEVREWLAIHPLPVAGAVVPASIALSVALLTEAGQDPATLAGPGGLVEVLAAIGVVERRRLIEGGGSRPEAPTTRGPIQ